MFSSNFEVLEYSTLIEGGQTELGMFSRLLNNGIPKWRD